MASAKRKGTLKLVLNFSNQTAIKRTIKAYALEVQAGRERNGWTIEELADIADVSVQTVISHEKGRVQTPHMRTMANMLFALGFVEITLIDGAIETTMRRVA